MPRTPPPPLGLTLTLLRTTLGWSQKELAKAAGLSRSVVCEYETGTTELTRERLEALAGAMGWRPGSVDRALFGFGLLEPPAERPVALVEPDEEELRIVDQAVAVAAREMAEALRADLIGELRQEKAAQARHAAEALWRRLKPLPSAERRRRVVQEPELQTPFLCERLCAESERAAASDVRRARDLAELALLVADYVSGPPIWRSRLQGYAWAFIGNARRVAGQLPDAEAAFATSWELWREGERSDPGVLDEALILDLNASLRRTQGKFLEALELHDRALAKANPNEASYILLNKSATLVESGDHERSIEALEQAAGSVLDEQPRLLCVLRFNQTVSLLHLGRLKEAELRLAEARELAIRLGNDLDLVRLLWLEGRMDVSLGAKKAATEAFELVRREFYAREMAYDFALASLELAVLYRGQERIGEVKSLAQQMMWIFKAQGVHREALGALRLFCEAAEKEELTLEMVRRLSEYLAKARNAPQLRFEA